MSRKYKFHNKEGLYFVSFAVVYWIDLFIRNEYCEIIINILRGSISWYSKLIGTKYSSGHNDHLHAGDFDSVSVKQILEK